MTNQATPLSSSKRSFNIFSEDLDFSFHEGPSNLYDRKLILKPQISNPRKPTNLTPADMQTVQIAKRLLCEEPTCPHNLDPINTMESGGFCTCKKQFCKEHFDNHDCSDPPETEILEIFKSLTFNHSLASTHSDNPSSAYYSSEQKSPFSKLKRTTIPETDLSDFISANPPQDFQARPTISDFSPAEEESVLNIFRRRRALAETTPIQSQLTTESIQENPKHKDLISKIENLQRSIELVEFMVRQKNSANFEQSTPIFGIADLPKKPFIEQNQNGSREKVISYEDTLTFTVQNLIQKLTNISKILFDFEKENTAPQNQSNQEN